MQVTFFFFLIILRKVFNVCTLIIKQHTYFPLPPNYFLCLYSFPFLEILINSFWRDSLAWKASWVPPITCRADLTCKAASNHHNTPTPENSPGHCTPATFWAQGFPTYLQFWVIRSYFEVDSLSRAIKKERFDLAPNPRKAGEGCQLSLRKLPMSWLKTYWCSGR